MDDGKYFLKDIRLVEAYPWRGQKGWEGLQDCYIEYGDWAEVEVYDVASTALSQVVPSEL